MDRLSLALESQLRSIFGYQFHPRVVLLDTEVFPDGLREGVPMRMFLIDAQGNETFQDDPAYFLPASIGILQDIREVAPPDEMERQKRYEHAGVDTLEVEMATLVEWFAACWIRADGQQCPLPAYVSYHDDKVSFDLKQMRWETNAQGKWTHLTQG
ncbi:MAG TPA: hypothetical protein VFW76_10520 [Ktedonobacterales bacterium]|nr:hypothetical protein [Ktedonobacterales bacterium]